MEKNTMEQLVNEGVITQEQANRIFAKKYYSIRERLEMTIGNMEHQGCAYWDDIEKLEVVIELLKKGKKLNDDFVM
jgi:hypothetical protein